MNSFNPDYFIHGANVLLLLAYSVRDILWLRLFALASSLIALPYFLLQPTPLWAPLSWSALFVAVNLFQSWRLFLERRPVKLTPEEEHVRRLVFEDLPPRKVLQVLSIGSWTTAETGERLIEVDQLTGPIALYPDALIFQILTASTNLDKLKSFAGWMGKNGKLKGSELQDAAEKAGFDAAYVALAPFPKSSR